MILKFLHTLLIIGYKLLEHFKIGPLCEIKFVSFLIALCSIF